jgi:predicted AAA+ superfamily ATPase
MCAHLHGQLLNATRLGEALGVSHTSVRRYLDALNETFVVRVLPPFATNEGKRLVRSPKVYLRDSGLLHALLDIETTDDLHGHPVFGASWEGLVIDGVVACLKDGWRASHYRTASGVEIDLLLERGRNRVAIECKASASPTVGKGFWLACQELGVDAAWVVAPVEESYPLRAPAWVTPLPELLDRITAGQLSRP